MSNNIRYILLLFLGFLGGCTIMYFNKVVHPKEQAGKDYVFLGDENAKIGLENYDSLYADGVDPNGVYNKPNGVLSDDSVAVEVAKLILFRIYGKDLIEKEKPYKVTLINDSIWSIEGQLQNNHEGGTFCILLNRYDSKVLLISHSK